MNDFTQWKVGDLVVHRHSGRIWCVREIDENTAALIDPNYEPPPPPLRCVFPSLSEPNKQPSFFWILLPISFACFLLAAMGILKLIVLIAK